MKFRRALFYQLTAYYLIHRKLWCRSLTQAYRPHPHKSLATRIPTRALRVCVGAARR